MSPNQKRSSSECPRHQAAPAGGRGREPLGNFCRVGSVGLGRMATWVFCFWPGIRDLRYVAWWPSRSSSLNLSSFSSLSRVPPVKVYKVGTHDWHGPVMLPGKPRDSRSFYSALGKVTCPVQYLFLTILRFVTLALFVCRFLNERDSVCTLHRHRCLQVFKLFDRLPATTNLPSAQKVSPNNWKRTNGAHGDQIDKLVSRSSGRWEHIACRHVTNYYLYF